MADGALTDFLLARIAEDEAAVADDDVLTVRAEAINAALAGDQRVARRIGLATTARVLAECEAKRRIVAEHAPDGAACRVCSYEDYVLTDDLTELEVRQPLDWPCPTVRSVAAVYAAHPDYDPAWAPEGGAA